jgi:hypothetical protein
MEGAQATLPKPMIELNPKLMANLGTVIEQLEAPAIRTSVLVEGRGVTMQWNQMRSNAGGLGAQQSLPNYVAIDRIQHESLKTCYRQTMGKPYVVDPVLQGIVEDLYRPFAKIGSGSTADAIRLELETSGKVRGKRHIQKGEDYMACLENWWKNNPTASRGDRAAVENIYLDLKDALGKKQWYSKTTVPN